MIRTAVYNLLYFNSEITGIIKRIRLHNNFNKVYIQLFDT